ncbi:glycosyltransferase family 4 protein [Geotalea uraniireducens]|uniref:Glycosyl transferase, group 1 n=1 Tax=Geotalea uraniireducens (strain Rf4) TaxID=351605 RepID=A5G4R1_GEOUR|nr:glycosyltransferase family 1 protein [Geotalea uraniireducens]ABQ26779.1 glycosyl transferase, group 1 [Geotalea uraniireducens Rf4]
MKPFKADLHLHSSHSNKPTYWAMRKFNVPESYTSPQHLYRIARDRGMDYVTITDHNSITGALEIAHLPNTFVSSEITAHFPENGCKVHVVVLNISEYNFYDIMALRKNVYELVAYLNREEIAHFLAHPIYAQNDKLTAEIIEKCLLLFTTFEVKNGCRARRFNGFTTRLISTLTEERIEHLADKHALQPYGSCPWKKGKVGGSDDHGGLFIARAHTVVAGGESVNAFLTAVRNGDTWAEGEDGGPLTMAHSLYGITYSYYKERFGERRRSATPFVSALLDRFFNLGTDKLSFIEKVRLFVRKNLPESRNATGRSFEEILDSEARQLLNDTEFVASIKDVDHNRKIFAVTSRLANRILFHYTRRLMSLPGNAGFFDYLNTIGTIGLVHLLISPYYLAFHHQHKSKELMQELSKQLPDRATRQPAEKIALFTDTLDEINGVAITIRRLISTARNRGIELTVITAGNSTDDEMVGVKKFAAVGDFVLPEYPELKLSFPPILDVMDFIEREGFTSIHVSTPGTVGLLGLLIARMMDIPLAGTYHTDIPQYVRCLTNDEFLEQAAWSYMVWFYNQMEEVMVPSVGTREQLLARGLPANKMKPLPRWVDTDQFTPAGKTPRYWEDRGLTGAVKLIYVGRVSREKSLELLTEAFRELVDTGADVGLVIIGDGPYRQEMETALATYPALFTGYLHGEELQRGYASADLFVFPSATDTFGNVVLEAQASGLPVIVSNAGGPRELMVEGETGAVFQAGSKDDLIAAIRRLTASRRLLAEMGEKARTFTLQKAPSVDETYSTILHTGAAAIMTDEHQAPAGAA